MHRKLNRATSHFRNCTQSTCNGHAHAYKARRVNVHWHVIIFRQLSWYGVPARQNRTQNRREEKSRRRCGQRCLRQRCSRLLCRQLCGSPGTSFACFEQHEPHHCSPYPSSVNMRTTSMVLSQRVSLQLSGGHRETYFNDHVEPFAVECSWPFFQKQVRPGRHATTRGNWAQKKETRKDLGHNSGLSVESALV